MDWKRGLTYMFLVGRLRNFFKLIFVWIPELILIGGLLSLAGMNDGDLALGLFIIIVAPLNIYIFSIYLTDKYVVGDEWAEQELHLREQEANQPGMLEDLELQPTIPNRSNRARSFFIYLKGALFAFLYKYLHLLNLSHISL